MTDSLKQAPSVDELVRPFVDEYVLSTEGADYEPTDHERALIEDALQGFIAEHRLAFRAVQPGEAKAARDPVEEIAKAMCLHHFGMAWHHAEKVSRDEMRQAVRDMLAALAKPRPDREAVAEREQWESCNCPQPPFDDEVVYDRNLSPRCPRCNVALGGDPMTATERAQAKAEEQAALLPAEAVQESLAVSSEEGWREERERLRAALAKARDALMLYDGHVTNPTSAEGWSDDEGYDAYMAAVAALSNPSQSLSRGDES